MKFMKVLHLSLPEYASRQDSLPYSVYIMLSGGTCWLVNSPENAKDKVFMKEKNSECQLDLV